jgi:ABC-type transport system involved in cytochrome c biogenesis ATPase subunit
MTTAPIFKITDLHIRGLRGLQKLDLPQDGMGWEHGFPPVSVIGGANGSGKTTLLRCIAAAAKAFIGELFAGMPFAAVPQEVDAEECRIDFVLSDAAGPPASIRFLVGDESFTKRNRQKNYFGYEQGGRPHTQADFESSVVNLGQSLQRPHLFATTTFPRVIFFPSDERDLVVPEMSYQVSGQFHDEAEFVVEWQRDRGRQRGKSLLELLFAARWADLNAKDQGKPEKAKNFERYTQAFTDLTLGEKRLGWTAKGELVVELKNGAQHDLQDLSSGERQALLLLAELRRFWRPGSLVLIDELELHLHDAWQGKLYDVLKAMQVELGGQVIITTQSHSLFEMADSGTRALLGRASLR